jgi:flagellar hook-length control protein FliK
MVFPDAKKRRPGLTQLSPQIQTELFPGAFMARTGILSGQDVREASEFAGRFAALFDMAREAPVFGVETAFPPSENMSFSPVREPDRFYDSRSPDTVQPSFLKTEESPESGAVSQKAEDPRPEDDAEEARAKAPAETLAAFLDERAERLAAKGREVERNGNVKKAENVENTKDAENMRAGTRRSREKAKIPGEDIENIPGFEEGSLVNLEPELSQKSVISGEPEEVGDDTEIDPRLTRSARGEKSRKPETVEGSEKPDGLIPREMLQAASSEDAAARAELSRDSGVELAGAEAAGLAAEGEGPERGAEFLEAETASVTETGLENAGIELAAAAPKQKPSAPKHVEKESREEPGEARKTDRRKLNMELRDFRTALKADGTHGNGAAEDSGGRAPGDYPQNHGQEQEIVVDLKSQARSQAEVSYNRESRSQFSFRETLARELHDNLNGDIVRHASVILKNGGEGLIRLSLRPEHLGNVKIRLEMSENKVVGRIVVESGEALRAFEQELRSLEQAFRDSGFEGATLEMSVSSDGGRGGTGNHRENGEEAPFFSERLAAHSYDTSSGASGGSGVTRLSVDGGAGRQVDVLA